MHFQPVSFSQAASLAELAEGLASTLDAVSSAFEGGANALEELAPSGLPGLPGLSDALDSLREKATGALAMPAGFLALTPFQHTVGTRKGEQGFLTPEQGLKTLASRFADAAGSGHEDKGLLVLVVAAPTQAMLGQALEAFNRIYPVAELEKVCRRAQALATLETDKFVIPAGKGFPAWGKASPQKDLKGQAVTKALGGMLAAGEGAAKSGDPVDVLAKFAKKQAGKVKEKAEALQELLGSMSGAPQRQHDAWTGLYLEGEAAAIARQLAKLEPPFDPSFKCSSLLCWYGPPDQVAFYRESFGL